MHYIFNYVLFSGKLYKLYLLGFIKNLIRLFVFIMKIELLYEFKNFQLLILVIYIFNYIVYYITNMFMDQV